MKLHGIFTWMLAAQLLWALPAFPQGGYKVEPVGAPPASSDLPKTLQDALEPSGARLVSDQGAAVGEIWLRKSVPTNPGENGASDIIYPSLSVGTFVGVVHFPNNGSDFRGQAIKAGYYTLRYAQIPQDGNHIGASPYRDFLLLVPATADTNLDKALTFDELNKLSRQASGTGHPAILSLDPATGTQTLPAAVRDDQGRWALEVKVPGKSAAGEQDLPMGIVLVGKTEAG